LHLYYLKENKILYRVCDLNNHLFVSSSLRFTDALQETLGFDWLMLFINPHIHKTTVVRATRILVTMLGSPVALERFKEGLNNGGWLTGTEMMLIKTPYVVAGTYSFD